MSARADRERLACQARLLATIGAPAEVGPRAARLGRRLAGRAAAPARFDDVAAMPDWAGWPAPRRESLADFAAACACTAALQRCIDGRRLARVARRIGEPALDAILATPPGLVPVLPEAAAALGEDASFAALGAGVLLCEVGNRPASVERLRPLFAAAPLTLDVERGRSVAHAARGLFMAFEAGALEAAA
ncbi:hypothetical protein [Caulobacter hibisci]|uniref:Uncharacterized protein n=1 Tax=Caulobacter hibisci TaxID=2035993 RepID=A0ABS0SSV1_9CAUL|nr:hypothetical protein [Caulobacter hibisci]MBI1682727.1 hypothetical protein [Caulobacter hibisci]